MIRRSRWLQPLVLEPFVVLVPLITYDEVRHGSSGTRSAVVTLLLVTALATLPVGTRSQLAVHRDGFNAGRRPRSETSKQSFFWAMMAVGMLLPAVPIVVRAAAAGAVAGTLQGAVLGSQVAYARLLRRAAAAR